MKDHKTKTKFYNYKITNLVNGKIYIGASNNPSKRWWQHQYTAKMGPQENDKRHRFQYVHRAIKKHGADNFSFEVIDTFDTEEEALKGEIKYIKLYNSKDRNKGYNLTIGGEGASGYHFNEVQKAIMSQKKQGVFDGEKNPFYGKKHTEESRKKISTKALERDLNRDRNPFYGKKHTTEILEKIMETKAKTGNYGKKRTLTEKQISEIRSKYKTGNYIYQDLADEYNIGHAVIVNICLYKRAYLKDKPADYSFKNTHSRLPKDIADEIRIKYKTGKYNQQQLSDEYKINVRTTNALIRYRGAYAYDKPGAKAKLKKKKSINYKKISDDDCNKIRKLYLKNYNYKQLSIKFNVSKSTIRTIVNYKGAYSRKK